MPSYPRVTGLDKRERARDGGILGAMTRQDFLSLLITFGTGVMVGMYLYAGGFAQNFLPMAAPSPDVFEDFSVSGERYGGCERGGRCAAFQVRRDGSYRYAPGATDRPDVSLEIGQLPRSLRSELQEELTPERLQVASAEEAETDCAAFRDGTDTRYEVIHSGIRYRVDTCGTAFSPTSQLGRTLAKLWNYFETIER